MPSFLAHEKFSAFRFTFFRFITIFAKLNSKEKLIVENATLIGISTFTNTGTTYRILGKGKPLSKVGIEASLRKIIQDAFTKNNIKLASIKN